MSIPLESAFLCVNCDHISQYAHQCAKCGEVHGLMSVSAVFNRPARDLKLTDAQRISRAISQVEQVFETCMAG